MLKSAETERDLKVNVTMAILIMGTDAIVSVKSRTDGLVLADQVREEAHALR